MKSIDVSLKTKNEAQNFVLQCEDIFSTELDNAVKFVASSDNSKVITLSGPTCSGKTTTAEKLTEHLTSNGKRVVVISIDDFFLDRDMRNSVEGEAPDYDTVKAIDLDYFAYFTDRLLKGKSVLIPKYDFSQTSRVGYHEYIPSDNDIYVFEGIQAVYPEISSLLGNHQSLFISVQNDIEYNGNMIRKNDIRLLRRVVRDYLFRGATAEFSLHLWEGVRANEEENIFPNAIECSVKIDSCLSYEPFILSRYALPLLETVPSDSRYRFEAENLMKKIAVFSNENFEDCMIPRNSVFREFIGK